MIGRRTLLASTLLLPALRARAEGTTRYVFDQDSGRIGFTVERIGFLPASGHFDRFRAELLLDPADPRSAMVDCALETAAVSFAIPGAAEMLRSAAFLDVAQFPQASFRGLAQGLGTPADFPIQGQLSLRGVTRPLRMEAGLTGRRAGAAHFQASGELRRGDFGMLADQDLVSDGIRLEVEAWLAL